MECLPEFRENEAGQNTGRNPERNLTEELPKQKKYGEKIAASGSLNKK